MKRLVAVFFALVVSLGALAQGLSTDIRLAPTTPLWFNNSVTPVTSWSAPDPFPSAVLSYSGPALSTMFDSTGKLTYKPNNLLTQSNTFSNAAWTKVSATITTGVIDRSGGTTASTLTATGAFANLYAFAATTSSYTVIQSIWIRRRTGTGKIWMKIASSGALFEITGQVTSSWVQVSISGAANASSTPNFLQLDTSGDAIDISEAGVSAVTYETTPRPGDQVITTASAYYGPRIDYTYNGSSWVPAGLLVEGAATNLYLQSNDLTNAATSASGVNKSTDGTLGPDGVSLMAKMLANAGGGTKEWYRASTVVSGTVYTASTFVKKGNHRYVFVTYEVTSGLNGIIAIFDLDNPSAATQTFATGGGALTTYGIINEGGGIYRIYVTGSVTGAGTTGYMLVGLLGAASGNPTTTTEFGFAAAGTEYDYFFGAQFEAGNLSSYIPTAAASVTRAADVVQFTGPALTALQGSAWSAAVQFSSVASYAGNPSILDTTSSVQTIFMNGVKAAFYPTILNTANSLSVLASHRVAASATRSGGRSIVSDGGTVATDATAMSSPPNTYLGSNVGANNFLNGHIASFAIYNQRLPDATLQVKSVVGASYAANDNGIRFANNDNLPLHWRVAL